MKHVEVKVCRMEFVQDRTCQCNWNNVDRVGRAALGGGGHAEEKCNELCAPAPIPFECETIGMLSPGTSPRTSQVCCIVLYLEFSEIRIVVHLAAKSGIRAGGNVRQHSVDTEYLRHAQYHCTAILVRSLLVSKQRQRNLFRALHRKQVYQPGAVHGRAMASQAGPVSRLQHVQRRPGEAQPLADVAQGVRRQSEQLHGHSEPMGATFCVAFVAQLLSIE